MEKLFYEIFSDLPRQGPGSAISTLKAAKLISRISDHPKILDIGCGTGTQTLELIKHFGGITYAVDNYQPFLDELSAEATINFVPFLLIGQEIGTVSVFRCFFAILFPL